MKNLLSKLKHRGVESKILNLVILAFILFLTACSSEKDFSKEAVSKALLGSEKYNMVADIKIINEFEITDFEITVSWVRSGEDENFKINIYDKSTNQDRLFLKNSEGYFELNSFINQAIQINEDLFLNSTKPYLYQYILQVLSDEHILTKDNEGWIVKTDVSYPYFPQLVKLEIKFNESFLPTLVKIYNEQEVVNLQIEFKETDFNPGFSTTHFDINENLMNMPHTGYISSELPFYPRYTLDAELVNSTVSSVGGELRHILEFKGAKSFTVLQVQKNINSDLVILQNNDEIIDTIELFGSFDGKNLTVYDKNVKITIYTQDLSIEEMLLVIKSMK